MTKEEFLGGKFFYNKNYPKPDYRYFFWNWRIYRTDDDDSFLNHPHVIEIDEQGNVIFCVYPVLQNFLGFNLDDLVQS